MEALITISYICTIVFGILSIILFFKLWVMTNNIQEIRDKLICQQHTTKENFRLLILQEEKAKAFDYVKKELTERLEKLFSDYYNQYSIGQSKEIIEKYNKMAALTGFQLPEHLQNAEKYIEYRKYIISITQQD